MAAHQSSPRAARDPEWHAPRPPLIRRPATRGARAPGPTRLHRRPPAPLVDLCDGRYDTPEHRLFKDLDTIFKDDFHNPTFPVSSLPSSFPSPTMLLTLTEFCTEILTKSASF